MRKETVLLQYKKCCQRIEKLEKRISGLPVGHLTCCKNGKHYNNYYRINWTDKPVYIPSSNAEFAAQLALREHYELQLKQELANRDFLFQVMELLDD